MPTFTSSPDAIGQRRPRSTWGLLARCIASVWALPACSVIASLTPHHAQAPDPNAPFVEPLAPEETSGSEEAGVTHLHGLLRCCDAGIAQTQFTAAEDCLSHAERGVVRANALTRSHPDFDDLVDAVRLARPRLAQAIERDRIAKRNAAIDALMARGDIAYDHANSLCMAQARPSPSADDVAELTDSHTALTGLLQAGEGFVDAPRYSAHAQQLQAALTAVDHLRDTMSWQLHTTTSLSPVVDAGFAAAAQAKAGGDAATQLSAYKRVAEAFAQCLQLTSHAVTEPGYEATSPIDTKLGSLNLDATANQCQSVLAQATDRINRFGWEHLIAQLTEVLPLAQTNGQKAAEALAQALPLLSACADGAPGQSDAAGAQDWLFQSPFGTLRIEALRRACHKEVLRLAPKQASLAWQGRLEAVGARMAAAELSLRAASVTPAPMDAVARLSEAKGSFEECVDAARALGAEPTADRAYRVSAAGTQLGLDAILKRCTQNAATADHALVKAAQSAAVRQFASGCHGDELTVLAREGMPGRVDIVGTGRVFVYGPHKRIAFDSIGRRTQEQALTP